MTSSPWSPYRNASDSCTNTDAPAAMAASTRFPEPSRRIRSFSSHALTLAIWLSGGILVARFTTASCPATASRSAAASKRLTLTGRAPSRSRSAAFSAVRAIPDTACPAPTSRFTARQPMTPVAPATNTFMGTLAWRPSRPS